MKTMPALKLLLIALLLFAGCDVSDDDDDDTVDNPVRTDSCGLLGLGSRVIGGTECTNEDQASVVRVSSPSSPEGFCTGSMITSNDVVTAAHCFIGSSGPFSITIGAEGNTRNVAVSNVFVHPQFRPFGGSDDRAIFDIAVLTLTGDAGVPVLPLLTSQDVPTGSPIGVFGYGQTVVGDASVDDIPEEAVDFGELVAGEMTISGVSEDFYFVENVNGVNVCFGDSGGPAVYNLAGQVVNLGVVSQGSVINCSPGDVTSYTKISNPDVISFILDRVPDASLR